MGKTAHNLSKIRGFVQTGRVYRRKEVKYKYDITAESNCWLIIETKTENVSESLRL